MSNTTNFKVVQYNIRRERGVIDSFIEEEAIKDVDVLAIQEPSWNPANQTSHNHSASRFHLAHKTGQDTRTCFYVNKRIDTDSWEVVYRGGDLCSLRITLKPRGQIGQDHPDEDTSPLDASQTQALEQGEPRSQDVWVHNIYNPSPVSYTSTDSPSTLPVLEEALAMDGEHVVVGDFNLHHPNWNNPGRYTYHAMADRLLELMGTKEMEIGLPGESVTWKSRGLQSAIDLVFVTKGAHNAMTSCLVRDDLHLGSDHWPIMTELEWSWEGAVPRARRAWKKTEDKAVREEITKGAKALSYALGKPDLTTREDIDGYLNKMTLGFQEIIDLTIPWAQPHQDAKSYWNSDCVKATKAAKICLRSHLRSRCVRSEGDLKDANHERVKIIRKAKTLSFRESVHKASLKPAGVWKLARWGRNNSGRPKELPQFPSIRDEAGGKTSEFNGKVRALRRVLFPPPPNADLSDIVGTRYPDPLETSSQVQRAEINKAIWHPAPDKAPGITKIPNRFLRLLTGTEVMASIVHLFQACLDLGYHPRQFKEANTIILKKPRKEDYSEPKSYRPIALLDTLGKALEAVISKKLSDIAEKHDLLPPQQMGARRGRSVETALETLTDAVHTTWNHGKGGKGKVASLLSLDVAGAFDNVSHERLLHNLRKKRVPSLITNWVSSFLSDRATSITLGSKTSEMEEVTTGIPQGSPISPVLFLFFNAPLIEECARANLPVQVGGFVDDVHLLAYGRSTEANCNNLTKAHEICMRWAAKHGASFAPQKYELIHMTRTPKKFNMKMALNFGNAVIEPGASLRVLGLYVDTKLRWGPHIAQVKARAANQARAIKCMAGSTWGATFERCRTVYSMVVRPMLTFAAPIWHQPSGTPEATKGHAKKLAVVQNDCLRTVLGAFRATPVPILEAESIISPIDLQLDRLVLRYQASRGNHPLTQTGNKHIWSRLQGRGTRGRAIPPTPLEEREAWALRSLKVKEWYEAATGTRRKKHWVNPARDIEEYQSTKVIDERVKDWARTEWLDRWTKYKRSIPDYARSPAQGGDLFGDRFSYHAKLRKAESSMAVQLRSGKIGLNHFLRQRKVPGVRSAECICGWRKQTAKHMLLFCPRLADMRAELI